MKRGSKLSHLRSWKLKIVFWQMDYLPNSFSNATKEDFLSLWKGWYPFQKRIVSQYLEVWPALTYITHFSRMLLKDISLTIFAGYPTEIKPFKLSNDANFAKKNLDKNPATDSQPTSRESPLHFRDLSFHNHQQQPLKHFQESQVNRSPYISVFLSPNGVTSIFLSTLHSLAFSHVLTSSPVRERSFVAVSNSGGLMVVVKVWEDVENATSWMNSPIHNVSMCKSFHLCELRWKFVSKPCKLKYWFAKVVGLLFYLLPLEKNR